MYIAPQFLWAGIHIWHCKQTLRLKAAASVWTRAADSSPGSLEKVCFCVHKAADSTCFLRPLSFFPASRQRPYFLPHKPPQQCQVFHESSERKQEKQVLEPETHTSNRAPGFPILTAGHRSHSLSSRECLHGDMSTLMPAHISPGSSSQQGY